MEFCKPAILPARREGVRACALFPAVLALVLTANAQSGLDSSHHVPVDKRLSSQWQQELWSRTPKVYKGKELLTIGMPCGGIAAGQLYVRGDGTLANWWIANNAYNTGYGVDSLTRFPTAAGPWKVCYQTFRPASYIDQGFLVTVDQGGSRRTLHLDQDDFDDISFIGEYPLARINYARKTAPLPLKIDLEVFSPFIPLNAKESATPATILRFTLTNSSTRPMKASLKGWLQNLVCIDLAGEIRSISRNRVIRAEGITSVMMDLTEKITHPYFGNLALSILSAHANADADFTGASDDLPTDSATRKTGSKLVGAVGTTIDLQPGESREIRFLLTWYFPNRPAYFLNGDVTAVIDPENWNKPVPTNGPILGNMYANWFGSSLDVAEWLRKNFRRLTEVTHRFHDTYYRNTTLPYWLVQRLLMPASTLATETCQWWANDKFWAWEGVGSCIGTCTHVWNYEQALAHLFPALERNIRERTDLGTSFQKNGSILARNGWGGVLIDGHAGAILKAYREYLDSKDDLFLSRNWDRIKRATIFLIGEDGNEDGLIEKKQANTYDIAFYGANTYTGSLYLAALEAASKMANVMNDPVFEQKCDRITEAGKVNTMKRLWNGEYFIQEVDLKTHPAFQYATGCLSDQLFGQTWAHLTGLDYIYPREDVKKALQSIWKYNWAPDVSAQNKIHPPERTYANAGEPGLLICTWPKGPHMGSKGVRYRDEVWTGIEYQVATNMIYEDMIDEGMSIVKGIHQRYRPEKHNPWNEVECGDHYARAMASWGVLLALENFYYNGPQEQMGFIPKVQQDDFEGFFTAAEAWGNIGQKRTRKMQANTISVKYGRLSLQEMDLGTVQRPAGVKIYTLATSAAGGLPGRERSCNWQWTDGKLSIHFNELRLEEGQQIRAVIVL
jgi:uncharacterized protein (DUF608 family)